MLCTVATFLFEIVVTCVFFAISSLVLSKMETKSEKSTAPSSASDKDIGAEASLLEYFPAGHTMRYLLPHMFELLDTTALIEFMTDQRVTYRQLIQNAVKVAAYLVRSRSSRKTTADDVQRDYFVQIYGDNSIAWTTCMYAAWMAGAGVATASPLWTVERFRAYMERVEATTLIVDLHTLRASAEPAEILDVIKSQKFLENIVVVADPAKEPVSNLDIVETKDLPVNFFNDILAEHSFEEALRYLLSQRKSTFPNKTDDKDYNCQIAFLIPSSGTTGVPKSIMVTHTNLISRLQAPARTMLSFLPPGTPVIAPNPYYLATNAATSVSGMLWDQIHQYCAALMKRPTCILVPVAQYNPHIAAQVIQQYRIDTVMMLVPTLMRTFLDPDIKNSYDLSSIKMVITGAWPLKPKVQARLCEMYGWPEIIQGYGSSEASGMFNSFLSMTPEERKRKVGNIGRLPTQNSPYEVKIVDLENCQKTLTEPNQRGELWIREVPSSQLHLLFIGYYKDPARTVQVMTPDGWYRTGDVCYVDEDGVYWHVERTAELIWTDELKWLAPSELEEFLLIGLESDITDVALVARTKPLTSTESPCTKEILDQLVVFVEPRKKNEASSDDNLKGKVCTVFNDAVSLPLRLTPENVYLCSRLPRNNSKIMRSFLRDMLRKPDELQAYLDKLAHSICSGASKPACR